MAALERQPVRVLTDTASSIRQENPMAQDLGIKILPLHITFPDGTQTPSDKITDQDFYSRLSLESIPQTSAVNTGEFVKGYEELAHEGARTIFSIHLSEKTSSTYVNAALAAQEFMAHTKDVVVHTVNTKTMSLAEWFIAKRAAEMAKLGATAEAIKSTIDHMVPNIGLLAVFNNLEYFKRGGRMAQVKGTILSALQITPVLGFDKEGTIAMHSKERTTSKARVRMVEIVKGEGELEQIAVIHTNAPELAAMVRDNLVSHFAGAIGLFEIGPTLAVHGGPNVVGICWEKK